MSTDTTPTSIEALAPRYKIGYRTDEWGERSSTPGGIPDPAGAWVRYDDHAAALARAAHAAAPKAAPAVEAGGPLNELEELNLLNKLIELGARAANAHAASNSDDGHKGTAAYVQWQELRSQVNNRQLKQTAFDATHSASRYVGASWTVSAQRFDLCRIFTAALTSRSSTRPQSGQLCTRSASVLW